MTHPDTARHRFPHHYCTAIARSPSQPTCARTRYAAERRPAAAQPAPFPAIQPAPIPSWSPETERCALGPHEAAGTDALGGRLVVSSLGEEDGCIHASTCRLRLPGRPSARSSLNLGADASVHGVLASTLTSGTAQTIANVSSHVVEVSTRRSVPPLAPGRPAPVPRVLASAQYHHDDQ